jgi:hypothetical protein
MSDRSSDDSIQPASGSSIELSDPDFHDDDDHDSEETPSSYLQNHQLFGRGGSVSKSRKQEDALLSNIPPPQTSPPAPSQRKSLSNNTKSDPNGEILLESLSLTDKDAPLFVDGGSKEFDYIASPKREDTKQKMKLKSRDSDSSKAQQFFQEKVPVDNSDLERTGWMSPFSASTKKKSKTRKSTKSSNLKLKSGLPLTEDGDSTPKKKKAKKDKTTDEGESVTKKEESKKKTKKTDIEGTKKKTKKKKTPTKAKKNAASSEEGSSIVSSSSHSRTNSKPLSDSLHQDPAIQNLDATDGVILGSSSGPNLSPGSSPPTKTPLQRHLSSENSLNSAQQKIIAGRIGDLYSRHSDDDSLEGKGAIQIVDDTTSVNSELTGTTDAMSTTSGKSADDYSKPKKSKSKGTKTKESQVIKVKQKQNSKKTKSKQAIADNEMTLLASKDDKIKMLEDTLKERDAEIHSLKTSMDKSDTGISSQGNFIPIDDEVKDLDAAKTLILQLQRQLAESQAAVKDIQREKDVLEAILSVRDKA